MANVAEAARLAHLKMTARATEFGKILLAIGAIVVTIVDRDTKQFELKPLATSLEIIMAGVAGALAFVAVAWNRGAKGLPKLFFVSIFIFALLQLIFELSGFNSTLKPEETKDTGGKKVDALMSNKLVWAVGGLGFLIALFIANCARDWPPLNYATGGDPKWRFTWELLAMGLSGGVPAIYVARNRDPKTFAIIKNFGINFVMMCAIHLLLQLSGFYRYLFTASQGNV